MFAAMSSTADAGEGKRREDRTGATQTKSPVSRRAFVSIPGIGSFRRFVRHGSVVAIGFDIGLVGSPSASSLQLGAAARLLASWLSIP